MYSLSLAYARQLPRGRSLRKRRVGARPQGPANTVVKQGICGMGSRKEPKEAPAANLRRLFRLERFRSPEGDDPFRRHFERRGLPRQKKGLLRERRNSPDF